MTPPSIWALSLAYWLHMLATVAWIGGLVSLSLLVLPAARQALDDQAYAGLIGKLRRRLDPLGWACLIALAATGLFQMSANPNYQGILAVDNLWAVAILIKHLVFLVMIGVSAFMTWGVMPRLQRAALLASRGQETPEARRWQQQEKLLLWLNLVLGVLVLGLTALARAS
jgi:uncharacterized membrane protein